MKIEKFNHRIGFAAVSLFDSQEEMIKSSYNGYGHAMILKTMIYDVTDGNGSQKGFCDILICPNCGHERGLDAKDI